MKQTTLIVLAIFAALFACTHTFAQQQTMTLTACWDPPTMTEDGQPLAAEDIKGYRLIYQQQGDTSWSEIDIPADQTCHVLNDLEPHVYLVAISAQEKYFDFWSDFSDPATGGGSPPRPPSGLRITVRVDVTVTQ